MIKTLTICFLVICIASFQCKSSKETQYDIPPHVPDEFRKLMVERAEKGKVLYKLHCAECHGIYTKGKDSVPNFTDKQIDNYHATALIGIDPRNHAVAKKMSNEQIDYVVAFLRTRKVEKR